MLAKYWLEKKGARECQTGSKVLDKSQCESACKELNIERGTATLEDGKPCFSTGKQICRQNGDKNGGGKVGNSDAALICTSSGN